MTNQFDPIDELRTLDPFASGPGDSIERKRAKDALFEEATMTTTRRPQSTGSRRSRWAIPATAGALALIVGVVLAFSTLTAPSALAAVTAATERTTGFTSGVADLTLEVAEAQGLPEGGFVMHTEYRYDGDDYVSTSDVSELGSFEVRRVGDVVYARFADELWIRTDPANDPAPDFEIRDGLGLGTDSVDPDGILDLIEAADDVERITSGGDETTYRATIPSAGLIELGLEQLPMGLGAVLGGVSPGDELPESLVATLVITDDVLTAASLDMDGQTPEAGYLKASIQVTYTQLGEPQQIEAPPADEVTDRKAILGEDITEALTVMGDLGTRRPGLCEEVIEEMAGSDPYPSDPEVVTATIDAMVQCYLDAGEPEAADAFGVLMGDLALVVDDLIVEDATGE